MTEEEFRKLVDSRMVTGEDMQVILSAYAEMLEATEPYARGEIDAAHNIGCSIAEIMAEV